MDGWVIEYREGPGEDACGYNEISLKACQRIRSSLITGYQDEGGAVGKFLFRRNEK